jgi:hypothetical protein
VHTHLSTRPAAGKHRPFRPRQGARYGHTSSGGDGTAEEHPLVSLGFNRDSTHAGQCAEYTRERIGVILERATERGEPVPDAEAVVDHVAAPMMYRVLVLPGHAGMVPTAQGAPRGR